MTTTGQTMDKQTFSIGILSLMAVILLLANFMPVAPVQAIGTIKDRDYSMVTGRMQSGGEGLYLVDSRTGLVGVFNWDPNKRAVALRAVRPISDCFGQ
jgi:hypothetical protein